jgi:hypothetical protein
MLKMDFRFEYLNNLRDSERHGYQAHGLEGRTSGRLPRAARGGTERQPVTALKISPPHKRINA